MIEKASSSSAVSNVARSETSPSLSLALQANRHSSHVMLTPGMSTTEKQLPSDTKKPAGHWAAKSGEEGEMMMAGVWRVYHVEEWKN